MEPKREILIVFVVFLFFQVILLSFKILDYPLLGNLLINRIVGHSTCKDCNVILISLDTLSANHLPCYGYKRNTAPNLCKFGEDNIMFTNSFSNASSTLPSHVSIFTGTYPNQHKVEPSERRSLPSSFPFLPEILQKNGYKTYLYMPTNDPNLPIDLVYNRGIDEITYAFHLKIDWTDGLTKLRENNAKGQKTFLFLHTYWVHAPYLLENQQRKIFTENDKKFYFSETQEQVNACTSSFIDYLGKSLNQDLETSTFSGSEKQKEQYEDLYKELLQSLERGTEIQFCNAKEHTELLNPYHAGYYQSLLETNTPENINHLRNLYDSKIVELDEYLKNAFAFIQNSELKKNTIIIVTADHGEEFMEHGHFEHVNNLYDTLLKVPLMMYIPGQKDKKIEQLAQSIDIVPTLLNILKLKSHYTFPGSDLLMKNVANIVKYIAAQDWGSKSGTIRDNEWKLFYQIKDGAPVGVHLFNYKKDPQEKNDVIFINPTIVERLLKNIPK